MIDDDPTVRDLMRRFLAARATDVVSAADGAEGLGLARELARMHHPRYHDAEIDGWSVLQALKEDPQLADTPVIMVSILDQKQKGIRARRFGLLTKPVDRARLAAMLAPFTAKGATPRVLVVEDERDDARADAPERSAKAGRSAPPATAARRSSGWRASAPKLILLDLLMPEMDGFAFLARLREQAGIARDPGRHRHRGRLTAEDRRRLRAASSTCSKGRLRARMRSWPEVRNLLGRTPPPPNA